MVILLLLPDSDGNRDYNAPSIVYKLSFEEYFVPFQALRVNGVRSWLPVRYNKVGFPIYYKKYLFAVGH